MGRPINCIVIHLYATADGWRVAPVTDEAAT